MSSTGSVGVVFVCHDERSIQHVLPYGHSILFVGNKIISKEYQEKVITVRDLPEHIEHEPKLLSFTAWYAICKNRLFTEYEYLCILEWDVLLDPDFMTQLQQACSGSVDAISFLEDYHYFTSDIQIPIATQYLENKGISYVFRPRPWGASTNQCLRRSLLEEFVDWYYPSCLWIKEKDPKKISWYHERLYIVFLDSRNIHYHMCKGLHHIQLNSHGKDINSGKEIHPDKSIFDKSIFDKEIHPGKSIFDKLIHNR